MIINSKIRINSDLGEGTGVEKDIMPFLNSCSIACGGHTGDKSSMTDTILIAKKYDVNIGAHPSYPDKENFGRKNISISNADLSNSLMSQIDDLERIARSLETSLNHIKLHGALYNLSANDLETASIIIKLMRFKYSDKILYVPYGSLISELAIENNIKIYYEVFLDRNYNNDLSLVSRENNNSMILDYQKMLKRLENVINDNKIQTIGGDYKKILADTFCVHGDSLEIASVIRDLFNEINKHNLEIE
ncbi:MAG: LamB/YcsF family protein [Flavobacteriaceae bacterium]|nr:LamB/YcsF family protein [Flavobacteriaceae bacterium]